MATNKSKIDQLHDLLPKHLNTRTNTNWKAIVDAIGGADQETGQLVAEVRKQFFIKTASRPYLDKLAANNKISRPRLVGMDDPSFREYIPILSYQPKQVKLIIDQLLDIFFFKESTTAFITSQRFEPFDFNDGWELEWNVDEQYSERIRFTAADFTNINSVTANEVVAAINRQTKYSYATSYYDSITKNTYIKMFSNTIGSKGSIRMVGGRANIALQFNGFIENAGNGSNTQWTVTKVGDETTFTHTAGTAPGIDKLQVGDIAIIDLAGNSGSFPITDIDLVNSSITFINLFSTPGVVTQTNSNQTKFLTPNKYVAYTSNRRALTWETSPGEIVVEMPTSPPVVKRSLKGSFHINGAFSQMTNRDSASSLTVVNALDFPNSGSFVLEQVNELQTRILTDFEDEVVSYKTNGRLTFGDQRYSYTSRTALSTTGDIVEGSNQITNLASVSGLAVGQQITMEGVVPYAVVESILGFTATISVPASETATGRVVAFLGNTLTGITPNLPTVAGLNQFTLSSLTRSSNVVTGTTSSAHNYVADEPVVISGSSGITVATTTGDTTLDSDQLTNLASVAGIAPDQIIAGTGIPVGTRVLSIAGNTVTMSRDATATATGVSVTFSENLNGVFILNSASGSNFTYSLLGSNGTATTAGSSRVERAGMSNSGSKVIIMTAISNEVSRITGPYIWDNAAPFVLSSNKTNTIDEIQAGKIVRLINVGANTIPAEGGFVVFDYGKTNQEGPIRYLYKPTDTTIAIDPSYTFKNSHEVGASITSIRRKGPHAMSGKGLEYPPYVTDPSEARFILQELIRSVKSAGIFVNFLINYPEQLYATIDVYQSGVDPG